MELRTLAVLFEFGWSTVVKIVLDTGDANTYHLLPKYVRIPQGDSLHEIVEGFERRSGFPHAVCAIDGSHIPILKPVESASDYFNGKCHCSVLMLLWWMSGVCLWMSTLAGQGWCMMLVSSQTRHCILKAVMVQCYLIGHAILLEWTYHY